MALNTTFFRDWLARNDLERFHVLTPAGRLLRVKKRFVFFPEDLMTNILNEYVEHNDYMNIYVPFFNWGYFWAKISKLKRFRMLLSLFSMPFMKRLGFRMEIRETDTGYSVSMKDMFGIRKLNPEAAKVGAAMIGGVISGVNSEYCQLANQKYSKEKVEWDFIKTDDNSLIKYDIVQLIKNYDRIKGNFEAKSLKEAIKKGIIFHKDESFMYKFKNKIFQIYPTEASYLLFLNDVPNLNNCIHNQITQFLSKFDMNSKEALLLLEKLGFGSLSFRKKEGTHISYDNIHYVEGFGKKCDFLSYLLEGILNKSCKTQKLKGSKMTFFFD